jgi:MFS family permease
VLLLRNISARTAMLAGCLFLLAGMGVTVGSIAATTAAGFLVGTAVAGVGFGLAFLGAFRMITALAAPDDRAGLLAAIFIVAYLAFSIPALIAGVATTHYGLHPTALVYSGSLAVIAAIAVGMLVFGPGRPVRPGRASRDAMPPGPCTGPPCPRAIGPAGNENASTPAARQPGSSS